MLIKRDKILKLLKAYKSQNSEQYGILALGIFGSYARGHASKNSDIDVVIETKTPDLLMISHIRQDLESQFNTHVDIVRQRESMNPLLKKCIERDVVYV